MPPKGGIRKRLHLDEVPAEPETATQVTAAHAGRRGVRRRVEEPGSGSGVAPPVEDPIPSGTRDSATQGRSIGYIG